MKDSTFKAKLSWKYDIKAPWKNIIVIFLINYLRNIKQYLVLLSDMSYLFLCGEILLSWSIFLNLSSVIKVNSIIFVSGNSIILVPGDFSYLSSL